MNLSQKSYLPWLLGACIVVLVALAHWLTEHTGQFNLFRRIEWMTYDWRVRHAAGRVLTNAPNLGLLEISDSSITELKATDLAGRKVGLYWARFVYGQALEELAHQGAKAVAFDVMFPDRREDHPTAILPDGSTEASDQFFANRLRDSGIAILGADKGLLPDDLFRTNALALGDISTVLDKDGILRRARAFVDYHLWNPLIRQAIYALNMDPGLTTVAPGRITLCSAGGKEKIIPLDGEDRFDQVALYEELTGTRVPGNVKPMRKAFDTFRVWDMGIVAAARELGLDLASARVETNRHQIVLRGAHGVERTIPLDPSGCFLIDWSLKVNAPGLHQEPIESLLLSRKLRLKGEPAGTNQLWRGRIAVVGSTAQGNDLTDRGATPLESQTFLTTRFLNVANTIITGRFIDRPGPGIELVLVALFGLAATLLGWRWSAGRSTGAALLISAAYALVALQAYDQSRLWLPMVFPLSSLWGALFSVVAYRAVFEQSERRRVRGVFAKIVSPNVVHELLEAKQLSLGGARRRITVLFADVRGFTEMTDDSQAKAEEHVRASHLTPQQTEAFFNDQSKEILGTVNLYLGAIADVVKKHDGTLDKYIGDCVMAFWGAPTPNEHQAEDCVRAAVEIQRAVQAINDERARENARREEENTRRIADGRPALPPLRLLSIGTGINTGQVIVGLMGSDAHIVNYTVFGREVNLASRLEGQSGSGRIYIGEATFLDLQLDDPALASTCVELDPITVKGFRSAVKVYEVPWRPVPAP